MRTPFLRALHENRSRRRPRPATRSETAPGSSGHGLQVGHMAGLILIPRSSNWVAIAIKITRFRRFSSASTHCSCCFSRNRSTSSASCSWSLRSIWIILDFPSFVCVVSTVHLQGIGSKLNTVKRFHQSTSPALVPPPCSGSDIAA